MIKETATLEFLGAVQNVTGSCFRLQADGRSLLVDCGLYQERDFLGRNWAPFPFPARELASVLLTHAHLDHCGRLPILVRQGFAGPIFCTAATADIARISLEDAAKLQEEDAAYKKKRHQREGRTGPHPEVPLYTVAEADAVFPLFKTVGYDEGFNPLPGVEATFRNSGHVLGSSIVQVKMTLPGGIRSIVFSGDLGNWDRPILPDPSLIEQADYVLVESTYGDRDHEPLGQAVAHFKDVINETIKAGGNVVIPSFALERSQEVLYYINQGMAAGTIPRVPVFLDSPMAVSITSVFEKHLDLLRPQLAELIRDGRSPFDFPGLELVHTIEQSKSINEMTKPVIIISGSGMATGGRVKHHLAYNISRPESTVLFVGYQAIGTLGRIIADGAKEVRILGQQYPVRARIEKINAFSAHADRDGLLRWLGGFKKAPSRVFITHGEPQVAQAFSETVKTQFGWQTDIPAYLDKATLD